MLARSQMLFGIIGLTLAFVASAAAQTTERPGGAGGSAGVSLRVRVPTLVRVALLPSQTGPDGAPTLQVVSNDPSIRRMAARGIAPELLQGLSVQFSGIQHSKGGEKALDGEAQVTTPVVRYTIVQP